MSRRTDRLGELLREELSWLFANQMHDPRLPMLVSITRVSVSQDLRHANVFISVMGSQEEKQSALKVISAAGGFLHRELKPRLTLRYIPELSFRLDESIEAGDKTLRILNELDSPSETSQ